MYARVHIYVSAHIYACMYVHTHTRAHIHTISTGIFRMHLCSYTYICTHRYIKYWYFLHRFQGLGYYLSHLSHLSRTRFIHTICHILVPLSLSCVSLPLSLSHSLFHTLLRARSLDVTVVVFTAIVAVRYWLYINIYMHSYTSSHVHQCLLVYRCIFI